MIPNFYSGCCKYFHTLLIIDSNCFPNLIHNFLHFCLVALLIAVVFIVCKYFSLISQLSNFVNIFLLLSSLLFVNIMPRPKKRSSFGKGKKEKAKKVRIERLSQESPAEKSARLSADADRKKLSRKNETDAEKESRLESMRKYINSRRSSQKITSRFFLDPSSSSEEEENPQKLSNECMEKRKKAISILEKHKRLFDYYFPILFNSVSAEESEPVTAQIVSQSTSIPPFNPVDKDYQLAKCSLFEMKFFKPFKTAPSEILGVPKSFINITNDLNHIFRAISVWLTGWEESHGELRKKLVLHAEKNRSIFLDIMFDFDDWLTEMVQNKTCGNENALVVMAHMLNTNIFVFLPKFKSWLNFAPHKYDQTLSTVHDNIYITQAKRDLIDYFMVVTSCTNSKSSPYDAKKVSCCGFNRSNFIFV